MPLSLDITFIFIVFTLLLGIILLIKPKKFNELIRIFFLGIGLLLILTALQNFAAYGGYWILPLVVQLIPGILFVGIWHLLKKKPNWTNAAAVTYLWVVGTFSIFAIIAGLPYGYIAGASLIGVISFLLGLAAIWKEDMTPKLFAIGMMLFTISILLARSGYI